MCQITVFHEDIYNCKEFYKKLEIRYLNSKSKRKNLEVYFSINIDIKSTFLNNSFEKLFKEYGYDVKNRLIFISKYHNYIIKYIESNLFI